MKFCSLLALFFLLSCTIMHHDEGEYGLMIINESKKDKGKSYYVYKDRDSVMMGYGCGLAANIELATKEAMKKYKNQFGFDAVGIADFKVTSYMYWVGIIVTPCLQVEGTPVLSSPM